MGTGGRLGYGVTGKEIRIGREGEGGGNRGE